MRTFRSVAFNGCGFRLVFAIGVNSLALTGLVFFAAANPQQGDEKPIEEVQVIGTRQIMQSSIDIKRNETTIAEGLSVADISDLPALAISEALATVTGVASLRNDSHGEQAG